MSLDRDELRSACDVSLYNFVRIIGGYVKQGADISPHIHLPVCDFYDDLEEHRRGVLMPRIWRKSTINKWKLLRRWLQNRDIRMLIVSENVSLGSRFLTFVQRQIMQNQMLRWIYEDKVGQITPEWLMKRLRHGKRPRWGKTEMDLPKNEWYSEATVTVIGAEGAAQSGHYDLISIDDIIGKKAMSSRAVMESILSWVDNARDLLVEPDISSPFASDIDITGTHWAPGDAYNYIQEKYPEFSWLIVPALKDMKLKDSHNIHWLQNPDVGNDECNYPEVFSTEYYREMRNNPEMMMIFWCQQQNNPGATIALTKFDEGWLRTYHYEQRGEGLYVVCDNDKEAFSVRDIASYGWIDPGGFTEKDVASKIASRNAMMIAGRPEKSNKKFVLYTYARKLREPEEFQNEFFRTNAAFRECIRHWRVECAGQQQYIFNDLLGEKRKRNETVRIIEYTCKNTRDEKHNDIVSLLGPGSRGEIYIEAGMRDFVTEWRTYPVGMTVDLLDILGKINQNYWGGSMDQMSLARINEAKADKWREKIHRLHSPRAGIS